MSYVSDIDTFLASQKAMQDKLLAEATKARQSHERAEAEEAAQAEAQATLVARARMRPADRAVALLRDMRDGRLTHEQARDQSRQMAEIRANADRTAKPRRAR
jgi:hypothetical protein